MLITAQGSICQVIHQVVSIATVLSKSCPSRYVQELSGSMHDLWAPAPFPLLGMLSPAIPSRSPLLFITTNPLRASCSRLCMLLAVPLHPIGGTLRPQVPACLHPDCTWVLEKPSLGCALLRAVSPALADSFDTYPTPPFLQIMAGVPSTQGDSESGPFTFSHF